MIFIQIANIMILDYNYHKQKRQLTFSYVTPTGGKALLRYNVDRFKTYVDDERGQCTNWNGKPCTQSWTTKPGWSEFKTFIEELPQTDKDLLFGKYNPRLYAFDIEVKINPDEFPEPSEAKFPILIISCVNDRMDGVVLGLKKLDNPEKTQEKYRAWLNTIDFYKSLNLNHTPSFTYIHFNTEQEMLEYFLKNFVSKMPVMAGWNSLGFDWQYIMNRIKNYYPNISFSSCSIDWTTHYKNIKDFSGQSVRLSLPNHTLVLDMMHIINDFDMAVMPIKESMALDYIATESIGTGKIKYTGDLQHLYETDYATYVFYNLVDSTLVQLIDKKFKTLNILYTQSLICRNKIETAFSKIAITESMFFNYFFEHNIKVVPSAGFSGDRPDLMGAYVRKTTPGKHQYVCCNDFASLYPSVIITCNLSIENYLGSLRDGKYTEADLEKLRKDPNYFVSVMGSVYKNDKDYSFKNIQWGLKKLRGKTKYLSKALDASVMSDIEHIMKKRSVSATYTEDECEVLKELGFDVKTSEDLLKYDLNDLKSKLKDEITFMVCKEQAIKLIMNSMYGGSSHVAFEWFNIDLANDITGEGRNLIHIMEHHIPQFFQDNWKNMIELHKELGIELK